MSGKPGDQDELARRFEPVAHLDTTGSGPPVEQWHPAFSGDLELTIARDGRWFYQHREITRHALKKLFAGILRLEDDGVYYLVTPAEKYRIQVEDAPFIALDLQVEGEGEARVLWLRTNLDDAFPLGPDHPLTMQITADGRDQAPYVTVRRNLQARVERNAYYHLVDQTETRTIDGRSQQVVVSMGRVFALGPAE